jgi:putative ABC transport system permease protein
LLPEYGSLVTGFIALTLMVFGFCLLVPVCLLLLLSALLVIGNNRIALSGIMALRNARSAINRTGLAVAALCVAVSVTVGVGIMVSSFRGTVILWLEQSLPGDFQLTAVSDSIPENGLPESLLFALAAVDGIAEIHDSVLELVEADFGPVRLGVNAIPAADKFYMEAMMTNGFAAFDAGEGVFISEPLAYLREIAPGDSISLLTDSGMTAFPVLGVFHDYTSGSGLVHMHDSLYRQYWDASRFSRLTLVASADADHDQLEAAIEAIAGAQDSRYAVISNSQLRALTLQIFDRTFAITNVLRLLAILVAFVGVLSTLMALQLEKGREFAILRATGMTPWQTAGLIFKQTTVLGICSGLLALPLGLLMSDVLIDVINRRSFGWTMQHFLPEAVLVEGFLLAVIAAILAGVYPAWRAGRIRPALALRQE